MSSSLHFSIERRYETSDGMSGWVQVPVMNKDCGFATQNINLFKLLGLYDEGCIVKKVGFPKDTDAWSLSGYALIVHTDSDDAVVNFLADWEYDINGYRMITKRTYDKWHAEDEYEEFTVYDRLLFIQDPDCHDANTITYKQFKKVINELKKEQNGYVNPDHQIMLDIMKAYEKVGEETRLIYWFRN